jgi:hypothetical protein
MKTPTNLTEACEFNSCPSGSPAVGYNASEVSLSPITLWPMLNMHTDFIKASPRLCQQLPSYLYEVRHRDARSGVL